MKAKHKDKDKDNVDYKSSAAITARDRIRGLKRIRGGGRRVERKVVERKLIGKWGMIAREGAI